MAFESRIVADLYTSDMGPVLLVKASNTGQLISLRDAFRDLSTRRYDRFDLTPIILGAGLSSFRAEVDDRRSRYGRSLSSTQGPSGIDIVWVQATDDWETTALLVEGLLVDDAPGHQYLTEEGVDDLVINLSYREH